MWWLLVIPGAYLLYRVFSDQTGEVQLGSGSGVKITKAMAVYDSQNQRSVVPAGSTIVADHFDNQGTMFFILNGIVYHSPIEEYSDKVA